MKKLIIFIYAFLFFTTNIIFAQDNTTDKKNGWDYYVIGQYKRSITSLLEEKKYFPQRINIFVILAWDYRELREYAKMEQVSLEGLRIMPTDKRVIKNLAEAYFFQKKFLLTIPVLEKYIKYRYNWNDAYIGNAYYYLGVCFYNTSSYYKAEISLKSALHFKKNDRNILLYLGQTLAALNNKEQAKIYFKKVLKISPSNKKALEGLESLKS